MGSLRKANGPLKVPRLRMKDELLKCAPELAKLLGEEIEDPEKDFTSNRLDTPRGHEEECTEAEELQRELAAVKKDRSELIHSLAHIKTNLVGSGGGEAQSAQLAALEKELALKKLTLNDLRTQGKKLTKSIADTKTQIHDAVLLTPGGYETEVSTIKQLMADMKRLDEDLIEAEAKNRLYYLLGERTRQDHLDMERKVRAARAQKADAQDDHSTLTQLMHDVRAAKEESERQLGKMRRMLEEAKRDWQKKMRDRKKEVQELKRRQERDELRELKRKERQDEEARKEQERLKKIALEQEAHEMQIQELAPKIEAMEASWNRLRTITGADEPEEVIAYWEGLQSKEENMRQLVAASESSEAAVKTRIEELLQRRNEMLEQDLGEGGGGDSGVDYEARIAEAHRGMCATRKKFQRLRTVCISAEQGLKGMLARAQVALQEITAAELTPASNIPQGTPPRPGKKLERRESSVYRSGKNSRESRRTVSPKANEGTAGDGEDLFADTGESQVLTLANGSNTIDDEAFFERLPELLAKVGEKLAKLLDIEAESVVSLGNLEAMPSVPEEESLEDEKEEGSDGADATEEGAAAAPDSAEAAPAEASALSDAATPEDGAAAAEEGAAAEADAGEGEAERTSAVDPGAADAAAAGPEQADSDARGSTNGAEQLVEAVPEAPGSADEAEAPCAVEDAVQEAQAAAAAAPQAETLLDTILQDEGQLAEEELENRLIALNKGMRKLDWSGAPLIDPVKRDLKPVLPDLTTITKRTKGRKRGSDKAAALERIMGFTDDAADADDDDDDDDDEDDAADAVLEREAIKRTAAKMEARAAKARSEAAA